MTEWIPWHWKNRNGLIHGKKYFVKLHKDLGIGIAKYDNHSDSYDHPPFWTIELYGKIGELLIFYEYCISYKVTHWAELPEPPEEK